MKNTKFLFIAGILIVLVIGIVLLKNSNTQKNEITNVVSQNKKETPTVTAVPKEDKTVIFECSGKKTITAVFHLPSDENVNIALSDGRNFTLPRAISASGARYANKDETTVFWNKGDTSFLEEKGKNTFDNCAEKSS
jgi:membrane-bound inhibitor of C-type lysozyme